ncbi:MAG: hypothetical protein AB7P99_18830 [Vicinamibacterales bacterium]
MPDATRLDSWKEIAQYLGRDVRTVIRWEERGLPVHRIPGGRLSRVFAFSTELDEWLSGGPASRRSPAELESPAPTAAPASERPRPHAAAATAGTPTPPRAAHPRARLIRRAAALAAGAALVAAWVVTRPDPIPRRLEVSGGELLAYDAGSSRPLWSRRLREGDMSTSWGRWHAIDDLDGDGRKEIVTAVEVHQPRSTEHTGMLSRLAPDGREEWRLVADDRVRFRDREYGPPWPTDDLAVYRAGGDTRIAWTVHQFTWWPGLLITVDARGERRGRFVNGGWLRAVQPSRDGQRLFISGISNSHHAYVMAVLDARNPTGRSPEPPGGETECLDCPPGDPLHYFVFPRTDVGLAHPFPALGPSIQTFEDGSVQVDTHEADAGVVATVIYTFSPDATLRDVRLNDAFWDRHRQLRTAGALTHAEADCPARQGLGVQHWTPAGGWQQVRVTPR